MEKFDEIVKAKVGLIHSEPFFATIALAMQFQENRNIKRGNANGTVIEYNPDWIATLNAEQVKGWLAALVMHVASLHHTRRGDRDVRQWNIACDHAINHLLHECKFTLPEGATLNPKFKGMAVEQIYSLLPAPPPEKDDKGQGDPEGNGGIQDAPAATQAEMEEKEADTKQLISQATMIAKQAGKMPGAVAEVVKQSLTPQVEWKEVLSAYLTENARSDYSFKRPNPRYMGTGLFLPVLESIDRGRFVLIVDTSKSVNVPLLQRVAGEMQSILGEVASGFTVIYVDTKVQGIVEVEADDIFELTAPGRGGTDFKPGFEVIEDEPAAVVYFTDGYCNSFPEAPDYPVLWAVYDHPNFNPPFGEVLNINSHE